MLRYLSLFSGIGGMDLAAAACGFEIVAFCEIDPFCRSVLQTHWPTVPIYLDVKEVTYEQLDRDGLLPIDLISGGPPCQPASLAGQRRGQQDDRWLWPQFLRVVGEVRPRWCVAENPVGILSVDARRAWGAILGTLVEMGYRCGWGIWGADDAGAPHRRERVFLLAHLPGLGGDAWWAESARQRGTPDAQRTDPPVVDACGHRQRIGPDQPERQSPCGSPSHPCLDGAQSILADAPGKGYSRWFSSGLKAHATTSGTGLESQPQRCSLVADPAGHHCQWRAQPHPEWNEISEYRDLWPHGGGRSDELADPASGETRRQREPGIPSDPASSGSKVADAQSGQCQRSRPARNRQSRSANDGDALANTASARREERAGIGRNEGQCGPSALRANDGDRGTEGSEAIISERGLGRGIDGLSAWVDHPSWPSGPGQLQAAWEPPRTIPRGLDPCRRKRLHALGNAVVPAQIAPLFRAIAEAEKRHSKAYASDAEDERKEEAWQQQP
jgi:site-specific DNA-cytosine methylase